MEDKHCADLADLLAGYALDALDGEDRTTAERHIQHCPECWAECTEIRETLHLSLGQAVPVVTPSPLVRTQFLAQLALQIGPAQTGSIPGAPAQPRPPLLTIEQPRAAGAGSGAARAIGAGQRYWWALGGAALPAALAIVLGVLFMHTQSQLSDTRDHLLADAMAVPHVAMPMRGIATSHGMHGEIIMPKSGTSGVLIVSGITTVPAGMRYTCWVRQGGRWQEAGVLKPDASGIAMMTFSPSTDLHQADSVAVTMERAAHTPAPSAPMLLSSTL